MSFKKNDLLLNLLNKKREDEKSDGDHIELQRKKTVLQSNMMIDQIKSKLLHQYDEVYEELPPPPPIPIETKFK